MVAMYSADTRATPGGEVSHVDGLLMCVTPHGTVVTNMALVTGPITGESVREATARMYDPRDVPYSVWTREHADERLEAELADLGFTRFHEEPGMVLGPEDGAPVPRPDGLRIRPVVALIIGASCPAARSPVGSRPWATAWTAGPPATG